MGKSFWSHTWVLGLAPDSGVWNDSAISADTGYSSNRRQHPNDMLLWDFTLSMSRYTILKQECTAVGLRPPGRAWYVMHSIPNRDLQFNLTATTIDWKAQ